MLLVPSYVRIIKLLLSFVKNYILRVVSI